MIDETRESCSLIDAFQHLIFTPHQMMRVRTMKMKRKRRRRRRKLHLPK
jgi:hypothetical protein